MNTSAKTYKVLTFGSGNWPAAEIAASVKGKQKVRPRVYAHPEVAKAVAANLVGTGSCQQAVVAVCDDEAAEQRADISETSGPGWTRL